MTDMGEVESIFERMDSEQGIVEHSDSLQEVVGRGSDLGGFVAMLLESSTQRVPCAHGCKTQKRWLYDGTV